MARKSYLLVGYLIVALWIIPFQTNAQILKDSLSFKIIKESIGDIYNLKFNESRETLKKLRQSYPSHPVINLLEGMQIYWEKFPLAPSSPESTSFEKYLRNCISLCENRTGDTDYAEYLLTNLSARGLLLLFYVDNNLSMSVIPLASSTYRYIRKSYDYTADYSDFFFFTGIYDYTREAYPEAYPVYKPVALLFPKGDKVRGYKDIVEASETSIFFRAEAYTFLSGINLGWENNLEKAYLSTKSLHELYPGNVEFLICHIRNVLITKRYAEAEILLKLVSALNINAFYRGQFSILRGILYEKKYKDDRMAEQYYLKGIQDISPAGHPANEFASYGYFGLSRISERKGDLNLKKTYRKKALELADFKTINFD